MQIVRVLSSIGGASKQLIAKLHKYYVYHHHRSSSSRGPSSSQRAALPLSLWPQLGSRTVHTVRGGGALCSRARETCCLVRSRSLSDQFQQRSAQHALLLPLSCVNTVLLEFGGILLWCKHSSMWVSDLRYERTKSDFFW